MPELLIAMVICLFYLLVHETGIFFKSSWCVSNVDFDLYLTLLDDLHALALLSDDLLLHDLLLYTLFIIKLATIMCLL